MRSRSSAPRSFLAGSPSWFSDPPILPLLDLVLLGLVVGFLLSAAPASACTCAPPGPPAQELERADAVFTGKVESIEPAPLPGDDPEWPSRLRVTLRLLGVWKGLPEGDTAVVLTASQSAACGVSFQEGKKFLVYAYATGGGTGGGEDDDARTELTATLCSRTALLKHAKDDLQALGTPDREPG